DPLDPSGYNFWEEISGIPLKTLTFSRDADRWNFAKISDLNVYLAKQTSLTKIEIDLNTLSKFSIDEFRDFLTSLTKNTSITEISFPVPSLIVGLRSNFFVDPAYIEAFIRFLWVKQNITKLELPNFDFSALSET